MKTKKDKKTQVMNVIDKKFVCEDLLKSSVGFGDRSMDEIREEMKWLRNILKTSDKK